MNVVVGLGNPGPRFEGTRHNAGFLVVEELARRHGARFRREGRGDAAREEARAVLTTGLATGRGLTGRRSPPAGRSGPAPTGGDRGAG